MRKSLNRGNVFGIIVLVISFLIMAYLAFKNTSKISQVVDPSTGSPTSSNAILDNFQNQVHKIEELQQKHLPSDQPTE